MPNIKAAEKWSRQSQKRSTRNKDASTRLKTLFKKAAATGDPESAKSVESAYDKAANKGVIHPNKAARKKARLARALRSAATAAPAKPAKAKAAKSSKSGAKTSKK